ncbi:MAG: phosphotransferase [Dehalococcoidia bacterium]
MFSSPGDLGDGDVGAALRQFWGLEASSLAYRPVGFGSHHWLAEVAGERWFVTVDDCQGKREAPSETADGFYSRLRAALATARTLRSMGLDFVVAPIDAAKGEPVVRISAAYAMAVYPYLEHDPPAPDEYTESERSEMLELLVALHRADVSGVEAGVETFQLPRRPALEAAMRELHRPWTGGPFAEPARALLSARLNSIRRVLPQYDAWALAAPSQPKVVTHGEPHSANTLVVGSRRVLIDWDTVLVAPPERDLWMVADAAGAIALAYAAATGLALANWMLDFYRLRWDLAEIAVYIAEFRGLHQDDPNTRESWKNLNFFLDLDGRWPQLT